MTNQQIIKAVRTLALGAVPDIDISELLYQHGCEYLLSLIPNSPYWKELMLKRVLNVAACRERYRTCRCVFDQTEIPYAVLKGAVLSQVAYGDPALRSSGDIDILIRRQDASRLKQFLYSNGFVQGRVTDNGIVPFSRREILFQTSMSHQTAPYIKETGSRLCPYINLDVNMDILWGENEEKADMDYVLEYTEYGNLFDVSFRKLTPEMDFLSLCLHHYKDMNSLYLLSGGSLRLRLFCDIYFYLSHVHPDVQKLTALCRHLHVGKYIYVCLFHTREIFGDGVCNTYLEALAQERDATLLDAYGLNAKERRKWRMGLLERLFHSNLSGYLQSQFTEAEKEKIKMNRELM